MIACSDIFDSLFLEIWDWIFIQRVTGISCYDNVPILCTKVGTI